MREFCVTIWGLAGIAIGHWVCGLEWVCAVFLFFPAFGLFSGIINNEGVRIVKNMVMVFSLPIALAVTPQISAGCIASLPAGVKMSAVGVHVLSALFSVAFLAVFSVMSSLLGHIAGVWALPVRIHDILVKIVASMAYTMAMMGFLVVIKTVSLKTGKLPMVLVFAVAMVAMGALAMALWRLFSRQNLISVSKAGKGNEVKSIKLAERPTTTFADVAGMSEVKDQIRLRLVEPVRNAARARKYGLKVGGGMLLYGPPGTGKTLIARAVAGELNLPFYSITAADVFGKYVGESERNIRRIFVDIRRNPLSVVFIDELETLFPKRGSDVHETTRKVIAVLLQELDGIDANKNPILLLGATNVPWMVDEAFMRPGRFDVKVFVGLPDAEARRGMLVKAFDKGSIPYESGLPAYMAEVTLNYSGADLNGVMNRIRQIAYDRRLTKYTRQLADEAIAMSSPTANGETMDRIHDWEAEFLPENSSNSGSSGVRLAVTPSVTLDDVAGMAEVKEQIRLRLVEPIRNHTLADMYGLRSGGGVLLYGPPGTGKTFLARAVAGELGLPFYCITAADVFGKYVGESERNMRRLFRDVRKNPMAVVFFDELESIFPRRTDNADDSTRKVISILLQELDGIDANKNPILLLGATNVPWMVDEAFMRPGRFDVKVFVGLPDVDARRQMFITALYSCKIPHEDGLTGFLAQRTEGYTGADINGVWERMKQLAYVRRLGKFDYFLAEEVLQKSSCSPCEEMIGKIREWERRQK